MTDAEPFPEPSAFKTPEEHQPSTGTWSSAWGPAWLVLIADVDAASILAALVSGAAYRYDLIWFLLLLTIPLFFVQEAAGRLGATTRWGLAEAVRKSRSGWLSLAISVPAAVSDVLAYIAEYAAIALALGIFGVPLYVSLPVIFAVHVGVVARGSYVWVERGLLAISVVFVIVVVSALVVRGVLPYSPVYFSTSPSFLFLLAANAGGVFVPFMIFFQSSATAEKPASTVARVRRETLIAAFACELLLVVFLMLGAGLPTYLNLYTSTGLAAALTTVGGNPLLYIFAIGLIAAAFLAVSVVSLGTAWGVVEALGLPRQRGFWIIFAEAVPAVLLPFFYPHLLAIVLVSLVIFVFILIAPAVVLGSLVSDPRLMGTHVSRGIWKWGYWLSLGFVVACGVAAVI